MAENPVKLAIKVDVDTLRGYRQGLPRLLDTLRARGVRASIFFSMGPDNSGKALRRIFRKGFISKMLRTRAPSTYGIRTMLYGTLLPAPMIAASEPDLLRRAIDEGHDCGVHAWDHVFWQDHLPRLSREAIRGQLTQAMELFARIAGKRPSCCAAPGWQVTPDSLTVQDEFGLSYCSDVRTFSPSLPFLPRMGGILFKTPQIASTLPTLDEALGLEGPDGRPLRAENAVGYYLSLLKPGLNVHTIHTEMEGISMSGVFDAFLGACAERGVATLTLRQALSEAKPSPRDVVTRGIPGRAGTVAMLG